jgi:hypothetical protein
MFFSPYFFVYINVEWESDLKHGISYLDRERGRGGERD